MFQNEEFINDFIDEANSHVEKFEAYLLNVESKNYDKETINSMFRSIHSIKGTAGFLGLSKIVKLSHSMENILGDIKSEKVALNSEIFEIFLKCFNNLEPSIAWVLTYSISSAVNFLLAFNSFWSNLNFPISWKKAAKNNLCLLTKILLSLAKPKDVIATLSICFKVLMMPSLLKH